VRGTLAGERRALGGATADSLEAGKVWATLRIIYAMRLRTLRNTIRNAPRGRAGGWLMVAVVVVLVDMVIFRAAPRSISLAVAPQGVSGPTGQMAVALTSAFNISFAMLFLASFPVALGTYTYRSDLPLLLPMPVHSAIIFAEKLITATLRQHLLVLPLLVPYLLGLGIGLRLPAGYYLVSLLIVLMMPIIPTCLGALTSFLFLTVFPPAQAKAFVTVDGAVLGAVFYLSQEILWSSRGTVNLSGAGAALGAVNSGWLTVLPPSWPAEALKATLSNEYAAAAAALLALLALNGAVFLGAVAAAQRAFSSGWADYQEAARIREPRAGREGRLILRLFSRLPLGSSGILAKEWLVFARDPQQWAALIMPLGVSAYFSYMLIFRLHDNHTPAGISFLLVFSGLNFLVSSLVAPLSLTITNREGRSFYLLRCSPISALTILREKFLALFLPLTLLSEALVLYIALSEGLSPRDALLASLGIAFVTASLIAWSMVLSLLFPRLDWVNIVQMTTWQAWLLSFVGGGVIGVLEGLFISLGPLAETYVPAHMTYLVSWATGGGMAIALGVTLALLTALFLWGSRRMSSWDIRW